MAAKTSAATERALARVAAGESAYAAAKAEGIALSTIYRALRKPGEANYAYDMGAVFGTICATHGDKITATAMGNISMRPDLMRTYLRHLDLAGYDIPGKPKDWLHGAEAQTSFWLGYYHSRSKGR
jgi:hypothetical protein